MPVNPKLVTTALELPGHRIVHNLGLVRGIVVRSRSSVARIGQPPVRRAAQWPPFAGADGLVISDYGQLVSSRYSRLRQGMPTNPVQGGVWDKALPWNPDRSKEERRAGRGDMIAVGAPQT